MHRERDSRGRFIGRCRSLIPTSPLTPPWPRSFTISTQTYIQSIAGKHRLPTVHISEIQPKYSPTSSTEVVVEEEDPTSTKEGIIFLSSTKQQLLGQEMEIPSEEEEETYSNIPLIEEP